MPNEPLPIDAHVEEIRTALRGARRLVLCAPPGSGKTTRIPPALLDLPGEIIVLEPRKIAARMAARRVAEELGETIGKRVGYTVRFEDQSSSETRIRFVTEGILTRRFLQDPLLEGVGTVILDEFHERHLQGDTALALVRALLEKRRDLHLLVMSATLDGKPLSEALGAQMIETAGRPYPVQIDHTEGTDERALPLRVTSAVRTLLDQTAGHILVFLPGAREIRECTTAAERLAQEKGATLMTLHGEMSPDEQDRVVQRSQARKVIFSTNVAESSVTIDGVTGVVDAGIARVASVDAWTGLSQLRTEPISQASATQRAGRAGRTGPGRAIRLYSQGDFARRPVSDVPEILRADLTSTALEVTSLGQRDLPWLTPPPERAWQTANDLLRTLHLVQDTQTSQALLSPLGTRAARLPVHPRLAVLMLAAADAGLPNVGALAAALLSERDLRRETRGRPRDQAAEGSDLEALIDLAVEALEHDNARALGVEVASLRAIDRTRKHLARALRVSGSLKDEAWTYAPEKLRRAVLAAFPDRVAKRSRAQGRALAIAGLGTAELAMESAVAHAPWMVALAAESKGTSALVRIASAIEPEWLIDLFPDEIEERVEPVWEAEKERVSAMQRMLFRGLVLDESRQKGASEETARLLFKMATARGGLATFAPQGAVSQWLLRVELAAKADARVKPLASTDLERLLLEACSGCTSFAELAEAGLYPMLVSQTEGGGRVAELAPERLTLPSGRQASVTYEPGKPPFIESYLQDFFGLRSTPVVGGAPVVMHLLAPNKRAVQVTSDLAGFWKNHYPAIRKELSRKYPRHAWPEDTSTPVPMKRRSTV